MLNKKQIKVFLGLSFIFIALGYVLAPLSVSLYVDSLGNWEWEEYFTDDNYIYQAESFRDIHYSQEGLTAWGDCEKDPNGMSGVYASISYRFTSETEITKAALDASVFSETKKCAVKINVNGELLEMFEGSKTFDITELTQGKTEIDMTLDFWSIDCINQDLIIQHIKLTGISAIPQIEETPEQTPFPNDIINSTPEPEKLYYRLAEYIRDENNPSLQKAGARVIHGWLHLIKLATGVVI